MQQVLDKVGDFFNAITYGLERGLTSVFGASNERMIRRLGFVRRGRETTILPGSILDRINQLEVPLQKLTDDELRQTTAKLRARLKQGEKLDDLVVDAFAAVRESGRRYLKMRHYDVQMIGGYVLHKGNISEMVTGEGKTLVATLPAFLNAVAGKVHIVTVNDYLARRDMEWMAPLYRGLGLTVGCIQSHQETEEKITAYGSDITFGTNNEFGFDYLRDNMKPSAHLQVQGPLDFAIVDEIDNILIDEARTPLIISGPAHDDVEKYKHANKIALQLHRDRDFEVKEKEHAVTLTEEGVRRAEELAGVESFYTAGNMEWPHLIDNALRAHHLYKRDVNYVVMDGEIIIVDEFTGRLMKGRQWSDGLHQAVEAKEGVRVKEENQTLATITLQNFFKLYKKLGGMTGTAMTEASEFYKIYKLDVVAIPTNRPMQRINYPDVIFRSEREKYNAIVDEIVDVHATGRPILVGTTSIERSEFLADQLKRKGVKHEVLNAKHHEREADIIAQAGRSGAVTIATNMAGRGTDILLGGNAETMAWNILKQSYATRLDVPKEEFDALTAKIAAEEGMAADGAKVRELGGLHVVGTERHEARRIDLQLRGRAGRQGDPGSGRFFLSLEDDLMRIFAGDWVKDMLTRLGMQEGEAIESGMVTRRVEGAQKKVEERHFDQRKHLLEYDEVMDQQRKRVYTYRQRVLDGANCRELIQSMMRDLVTAAAKDLLDPNYGRATLAQWCAQQASIEVTARDLRGREIADTKDFLRSQAERQAEDLLRDKLEEDLPPDVEDEREWNWLALSKWVNTRWGLNTNDRELKKIGRDEVDVYLSERIREAIGRADFAVVDNFLDPEYGRRQLSEWLANHFLITIEPSKFGDTLPDDAAKLILAELDKAYNEKEIKFPVSVGMHSFLGESREHGRRNDREGLVDWARGRFALDLPQRDFDSRSVEDIQSLLTNASRQFYRNGELTRELETRLDRAYATAPTAESPALTELVEWARQEFQASLDAERLAPLPRAAAREQIVDAIATFYRPELRHAERSLILETLDQSWKDHLYFMDHLRQGIGLVGYAQQDPKVEYKREGMKAFDQMWKRISHEVTFAIFRLESESPAFMGSLWQITSETHAAPERDLVEVAAPEGAEQYGSGGGHSAPVEQAIEPIRNFQQRVGRNDPCPCGSGKKYKSCCLGKK
jgi:preprotein translocase subunit SecA